MAKRLIVMAGAVVLLAAAGCSQQIAYREFYEPNGEVKLQREDGTTVGAVKVEATKQGVPNWSDNKSFSVSFFGL